MINALLKREVVTKFGEYKLGFFWMLLEPLVGVLVVGVILGTIVARTVPEIPYSFFVLNGMLIIKLLTGPMNTGMSAVGANQGLLVYPTVRPLDTFIARFILQLLNTLFSFFLFCIVAMWIGISLSFDNLHILFVCFFITWLSGCGLGLILGVAAAHFRETEKVLMVVQRPLLFISAVLFPMSVIPASAQKYLLYNPVVHTIELSRWAMFPHYHVEGCNLIYPSVFAIIVLSIGLTLFHGNRNFMSQS
ncbi:MAG: ABC transporter permease [Luteolibacter sp.]